MGLWEKLKGAFKSMFSSNSIQNVLGVTPSISTDMKEAIELWESMYTNKAPWLNENVHSLGLPAMIASEKARMATLEMEVKITGDSKKADFIRKSFEKLLPQIRTNLEYGIAFGGLVVKPYVIKDINDEYSLDFSFVQSTDFYPLSFTASGGIKEAAFIDEYVTKDSIYTKVEHHDLEGTTLTIKTLAFKKRKNDVLISQNYGVADLGEPVTLDSVEEWSAITPTVTIENVNIPLFAYFKMPQANTVDPKSPLGVSGFSRAVALIKDADEQYGNLLWEFEGGQLAIDVDRTALNPTKDKSGTHIYELPKLQQRLFRHDLDLGEDDAYNVFNPDLRDANIINGLNTILTQIEDKCCLGRGTLSQVQYTDARTATELKILKQRSYADNCDIQKALQTTLEQVLKIIDVYCELYFENKYLGEYEVAFKWDDSIIVDKDKERETDLLDVDKGLMSRVEYRMKWYGETETQAEEAIKRIDKDQEDKQRRQQEMMAEFQQKTENTRQAQNTDSKSDAQASYEKKKQTNASSKTTKTSAN